MRLTNILADIRAHKNLRKCLTCEEILELHTSRDSGEDGVSVILAGYCKPCGRIYVIDNCYTPPTNATVTTRLPSEP